MPERTTFAPPAPQPSAAATERGENPMVERIWQTNDYIVSQRYKQAEQALLSRHQEAHPENIIALAYAMQRHAIEKADTDSWKTSEVTANHLALVMLGAPNAARAQANLDKKRGAIGGQERRDNVAILSNFNNDLGATLAYASPDMLNSFTDNLVNRGEKTLKNRLNLPTITKEHAKTTLAGIAREVKVQRALFGEMPEGWSVRGSTVEEDVRGTDLIVTDDLNRELRLDVKSSKSFDKTVLRLRAQGELTAQQADRALKEGYFYSKPRSKDDPEVCIFDADQFEKKGTYDYADTLAVFEFIEDRFKDGRTRTLRNVGKSAIIN